MSIQWKDVQIEQPVCVLWVDAEGRDDWEDREDAKSDILPIVRTWGEVLDINKDHISVSQNVDDKNSKVSHTMHIPLGMVREIIFI